MTTKQARAWLETMIEKCGMGFHPDTPLQDYRPRFNPTLARKLEAERDLAFEAFEKAGKDIYAEGLRICERRGLIPGEVS